MSFANMPMLPGLPPMMGPGVMQLVELLPEPSELEEAAAYLDGSGIPNEALMKSAKFLAQLALMMKQSGLMMEGSAPTEALRLSCPTCGKSFAVDDAAGYWGKVSNGFLYQCSNGGSHEATIIGSGRKGSLTEPEQLAHDAEPQLVTIA